MHQMIPVIKKHSVREFCDDCRRIDANDILSLDEENIMALLKFNFSNLLPEKGLRGHISDDACQSLLFLYLVLICFCHINFQV